MHSSLKCSINSKKQQKILIIILLLEHTNLHVFINYIINDSIMNPSLLIQSKHKKAQTQLSSASRYRQTPTAQMNNFVYASLYYKKSHSYLSFSENER